MLLTETGNHYRDTEYYRHLKDAHQLDTTKSSLLYKMSTHKTTNSWVPMYLPQIVASFEQSFVMSPADSPRLVDTLASSSEQPFQVEQADPSKASQDGLQCELPHCPKSGKAYRNKWNLQQHVARFHTECYPTRCPIEGCANTLLLPDFHVMYVHSRVVQLKHSMDLLALEKPHSCRCARRNKKSKRSNGNLYTTHLCKARGLNGDVVLLDSEKDMRTFPCFVPRCDADVRFRKAKGYDARLAKDVQLFTMDARLPYLKGEFQRWLENFAFAMCGS
jgi:hypothetical protein